MSWKIGDLCVAKSKQFGWTNSEIKQINQDVAKVEFIEYDGDEEVNISDLKLFGPFAVNNIGELVEGNNDAGVYDGWKVGDACVAQWTQDGAWYNSKILRFFNEDEILVRFVDYGNADFTTLGNLKPAGSPLENAVCPSLESSINDSKTEVTQRAMKRTSFATRSTTRPWRVFDKCVSRWSEDGLWYMSQILAINGQQVTVLFTQYGNEGVTTLDQLKNVNSLEESDEIKTSWKVGDLCVALWNEDDVWYNSQIVEIKGDRVLVRFTDYGNEDYTTLDKLKPFGSLDGELMEAIFTPVKKTSSSNERNSPVGSLPSNAKRMDTLGQLQPAGPLPSNAEGIDKLGHIQPAGSLTSNVESIDTLGQVQPAGSLPSNPECMDTLGELQPSGSFPTNSEGMDTLGHLQPAGSLPSNPEGIDKEKAWAVGDPCVARWEEDLIWYNSKIIEIHGEKALVRFVDYGNEDFAHLSQLKPAGTLELEDLTKGKVAIPQVNKGAIPKVKKGKSPKVKTSASDEQLPTSENRPTTEEEISAAKGRINVPKAFGRGRARGHPVRNDVSSAEDIAEQLGNIFPYFSHEFLLDQARKFGTIENAVNELLNYVHNQDVLKEKEALEDIAEQLKNLFPDFPPEFLLDQARKSGTVENAVNELLNYIHNQGLLKEKEDENNCVKERVAKSLLLLGEQDMFEKVTLTEKRDFNPDDPLENKFRLAKGHYLSVSDQHTRPIESIDYVENRILMEIFERKRNQFKLEGKDTKEYFLFHGTDDDNVDSILRENFQMDYAGKNGQAYGRGIYFSEKTEIPDDFMKGSKKKLLLCRVLLGREFLGEASDIPEGFDSKSVEPDGDRRADINVIKEVDQILPCFVLTFGSSAEDQCNADPLTKVSFRRRIHRFGQNVFQSGASSAISTSMSQYGQSSRMSTNVPQIGVSSATSTNVPQYGASFRTSTNVPQYRLSSVTSTNVRQYGASSRTSTNVPQFVQSSGTSTNVPQYRATFRTSTNSAIPTSMLQYGVSSAAPTSLSQYGASSSIPTNVSPYGSSIGAALQMAPRLNLATCPYDASHRVRQDMMQIHITKCSKRP